MLEVASAAIAIIVGLIYISRVLYGAWKRYKHRKATPPRKRGREDHSSRRPTPLA